MKLTREFLEKHLACKDGVEWFLDQNETDPVKICLKLAKENHWPWANWLIVRLMTHEQKVKYAVFAAEKVLDLFEKKYPKDDRPRKAIDAAKAWIKDPSEKNRSAAAAAATTAYAADDACAAYAAYAAYAADAADACAAYAADAAREKFRMKILKYGICLLRRMKAK